MRLAGCSTSNTPYPIKTDGGRYKVYPISYQNSTSCKDVILHMQDMVHANSLHTHTRSSKLISYMSKPWDSSTLNIELTSLIHRHVLDVRRGCRIPYALSLLYT